MFKLQSNLSNNNSRTMRNRQNIITFHIMSLYLTVTDCDWLWLTVTDCDWLWLTVTITVVSLTVVTVAVTVIVTVIVVAVSVIRDCESRKTRQTTMRSWLIAEWAIWSTGDCHLQQLTEKRTVLSIQLNKEMFQLVCELYMFCFITVTTKEFEKKTFEIETETKRPNYCKQNTRSLTLKPCQLK
jgi:hypothetical protein